MATTIRSDLVVPEVLAEAVQGEFANMQALYGTGTAVVASKGFPSRRGGDTITFPYFGTIGEFEDLASNEGAGGAVPALTPAKLTQTTDTATVQHSGKAFEITEWAQLAAMFDDPYAEAARQIRVGLNRKFDDKLLVEAATTTLALDIYDSTGATGQLDWQQILDARALWGDEQDGIALVTMHSDVAFALLKKVKADGSGDTNEPLYPAALQDTLITLPGVGVPIRVTDKATKTLNAGGASTATSYVTNVYKRGSLGLWYMGNPDIQTDKDILADSQVAAMHVYYAVHLYNRVPGSTKEGVVKITHNLP